MRRILLFCIVASLGCKCASPLKSSCKSESCSADVECRAQEEIHVNLPPQKIVVQQAPQQAPAAPQAAPQFMPQMAPAFAAPAAAAPATETGVALGMGWVRLPLPVPRMFAVQRQREVSVPVMAPTYIAAAPQYSMPMQFAAVPAPAQAPPQAPAAAPSDETLRQATQAVRDLREQVDQLKQQPPQAPVEPSCNAQTRY